MRKLATIAVLIAAVALPSSVAWSAAATHPSYPRVGKSCKVGYHGDTESHIVKGKKVRYVECEWTTSTAATSPTSSGASGVSGSGGGTPPAKGAKGDPPTDVVVTSSANPGLINDAVIYTVTVASVAIPQTTGQIEVSDNGQPVQGCFPIPNPTYNADGTFSGTCTVTYAQAETDTIVGVFTGDSEFAQSAGSLTETVSATPPVTPPSGGGGSGGSGGGGGGSSIPTPVIALSVALSSPAYTQSNSNYLELTYSATASSTSNSAPATTEAGTLTFYSDNVPECTMAVGGSNSSTASCIVSLSAYGSHTVNVSYSDGQGDTATTGVQSETIEPPDITVQDTWGTNAPTEIPTATVNVIGSTASVSVSDANFEGASTVTITDQLGDSCTASIGTTTATCSMSVTGTPTSLDVAYPGGTATTGSQSVAPNGTQNVTYQWGSVASVAISGAHLTVSVQQATVTWASWSVQGSSSGSSNPPNPINIAPSHYMHLFVSNTGNVSPDSSLCNFGQSLGNQEPCGSLEFTVTGGSAGDVTTYNEDSGSSDCSMVQNATGQAEGGCDIVFNSQASGEYQVSVTYEPGIYDSNYSNTTNPIVITVNVS